MLSFSLETLFSSTISLAEAPSYKKAKSRKWEEVERNIMKRSYSVANHNVYNTKLTNPALASHAAVFRGLVLLPPQKR